MTLEAKDIDAWIDAMGPVLKLKIDDAYRAGVRANLEVALRMAEKIEAVPLEDDAEPAPVYRA